MLPFLLNKLTSIAPVNRIIGALVLLTLWPAAFPAHAQPRQSNEVRELIPDQTMERELSGPETHLYKFELHPNEFFQIRVEQKGIDLVLKLQDAIGNVVATMDTPNGNEGPETLTFVTEQTAAYILIVTPLEAKAEKGKYTIRREPSRTATDRDKRRVAVEHVFADGVNALNAGQSETAITKLEAALAGWKELQDSFMVATTAQGVAIINANLYFTSGDLNKALEFAQQALPLAKELKDRNNEVISLYILGGVYSGLGEQQKALAYLSEALPLARSTGNKTAEVLSLTYLGHICAILGEQPKALEYLRQALPLAATQPVKILEVQVLTVTGRIHLILGHYEEAFDYLIKGLSLSKAIGDRNDEALLLSFTGVVSSARGEQLKALEYLNEGLALSRTVDNKSAEILALTFLGNTYVMLGDPQKALPYLNEAIPLAEAISDLSYRALVFTFLGKAHFGLGHLQQALDYLTKALPLARSVGNKNDEAVVLAFTGGVQSALGDQNSALESLEKALSLTKAGDNKAPEITALNFLGLAHLVQGAPQTARDSFNRALALAVETGDRSSQLFALIHLGAVHFELGEPTKALAYLDQALPIIKSSGDKAAEALRLCFLGVIHSGLGDQLRSLEYLNQALPIAQAGGAQRLEASILNILGKANIDLVNLPQAREYLEQALQRWRVTGEKRGEMITLNNLGLVHQSTSIFSGANENSRALEYFNQALTLAKAIGDRTSEATILNNLGVLALSLGQQQKAVTYFNEALPLVRAGAYKSGEARILGNLMVVWNSLSNKRLAVLYGKQSVNAYQHVRTNMQGLDKTVQKTFLQSVEDTYRYLGNILIEQERLAEAQVVLELVKEAEFSGSTRRGVKSDALEYSKSEAEVIETVNRLAAIGREYEELSKKKNRNESDEQHRQQLNDDLKIANAQYQKTVDALSVIAKDNESYQSVSAGAKAFRGVLTNLGDGTVALYSVIVRDEKSQATVGWIILVTPSILKAYPIDVAGLNQTVAEFRAAITNSAYDPQPLAQKLYQKIFLQVSPKQTTSLADDLDTYLKDKKNKTLMWSLDGVLRYVPMAALHDGKQYLVEKYRNVVFISNKRDWLTSEVNPHWTALGLGVSQARVENGVPFPALPGAGRELKKIVRDESSPEGILPGEVRENEAFTRNAMLTLLSKGYPIVHISSHFSHNEADFDRSFLLLGQGRWNVGEMRVETSLFSEVDLVALSACDTALGQANGKDAEGFAVLAQDLGAKSVIASLWPVDDISTQVLMPLFYRLRETGKAEGMSKAEAFQLAQLALLRGEVTDAPGIPRSSESVGGSQPGLGLQSYGHDPKKPFAHPYYWAPFILIGNWK